MKELTLEEFRIKYGEELKFDEKGIINLGFGYYAQQKGDTVKIYEEGET